MKGLAEATGLEDDSVTVSVNTSEVTLVNERVLKLVVVGASALGASERIGTGLTVTAVVSTTSDSVVGGVLPPSQMVVPLCSAKENGL